MAMQYNLKNRPLLIVILLALVFISLGFWFWFKPKELSENDNLAIESSAYKYLPYFIKAGEKLKKYWEFGEYPNLEEVINSCGELHWESSQTGVDYLNCNPQLFQCYFSGQIPGAEKEFEVEYNNKKETVQVAAYYPAVEILSRKKRYYQTLKDHSIEITLQLKSDSRIKYTINFSKTCNETFLPEKRYSHSQKTFISNDEKGDRDKVKEWDHKGVIYVDKYLVSKHDIFEWKLLNKIKGLKKNIFSWTEYADNLSLNEMKDYCHSRGKKLLSTRIYDAASFFRDESKEHLTSLFAWGDRNKGLISPRADFLDQYESGGKVPKRTCHKIPTKECLASFRSYEKDNISWMGIHDVMGGYLEAMDNQEYPYFNIKASSFYFDQFSPWHLLSHRFHWDGRGFESKNFTFDSSLLGTKGDAIEDSNIKVGFRCMREVQ